MIWSCEEPKRIRIPEQREEDLGGKVRTRWREWMKLSMRREVWRVVKQGIWLSWTEEGPPKFEMRNRKMKEEEEKVIEKEIRSLKRQRVLRTVEERKDQCVLPGAIGEREGEKRMVGDFKRLNE